MSKSFGAAASVGTQDTLSCSKGSRWIVAVEVKARQTPLCFADLFGFLPAHLSMQLAQVIRESFKIDPAIFQIFCPVMRDKGVPLRKAVEVMRGVLSPAPLLLPFSCIC